MPIKTVKPTNDTASAKMIFRFEVLLFSGLFTQSFVDKQPQAPSRVIDIRGSQTLDDLHEAIFAAFDRYDAHMYEFQIGGKKPMDKKAVRYGLAFDGDFPENKTESAEAATIISLNLKTGNSFFYWFDFGDDWWHEVRLLAVNPPAKGGGRYPRIVERKGESPPQYPDWDEEDEEEDDEFDPDMVEAMEAPVVPPPPKQKKRAKKEDQKSETKKGGKNPAQYSLFE